MIIQNFAVLLRLATKEILDFSLHIISVSSCQLTFQIRRVAFLHVLVGKCTINVFKCASRLMQTFEIQTNKYILYSTHCKLKCHSSIVSLFFFHEQVVTRNLCFIKTTGKFQSYTTSTSSGHSTPAGKTLAFRTNQERRHARARA
jgi:hypothetical protein